MDWGVVTYPAEGKKTEKGEDFVENIGVSPDIEVTNRPEDFIQGKDRQLERSIEEILKQIKKVPKDN
jgi:tricorn protease